MELGKKMESFKNTGKAAKGDKSDRSQLVSRLSKRYPKRKKGSKEVY